MYNATPWQAHSLEVAMGRAQAPDMMPVAPLVAAPAGETDVAMRQREAERQAAEDAARERQRAAASGRIAELRGEFDAAVAVAMTLRGEIEAAAAAVLAAWSDDRQADTEVVERGYFRLTISMKAAADAADRLVAHERAVYDGRSTELPPDAVVTLTRAGLPVVVAASLPHFVGPAAVQLANVRRALAGDDPLMVPAA